MHLEVDRATFLLLHLLRRRLKLTEPTEKKRLRLCMNLQMCQSCALSWGSLVQWEALKFMERREARSLLHILTEWFRHAADRNFFESMMLTVTAR